MFFARALQFAFLGLKFLTSKKEVQRTVGISLEKANSPQVDFVKKRFEPSGR